MTKFATVHFNNIEEIEECASMIGINRTAYVKMAVKERVMKDRLDARIRENKLSERE